MKFPQAEITNGLIKAKLYLPDPKNGYYQGTRFDWSGNMPNLEYKGHTYFGQWFTNYSPEIHDVIMGPVEDFTPPDFPETRPGDNFLKIGVGILTKPDKEPYEFSRLYPVVNPGKWKVKKETDRVTFYHDLKDKEYSYQYEKNVQLINGKPELVLSHSLKNTGRKIIDTNVYDHNFFMIDRQPVGPGYVVSLPYIIESEGVDNSSDFSEVAGKKILFRRNVRRGEDINYFNLAGYGPDISDYDIRIENRVAGAGVRITCDQPILKLAFWCCSTTLCPEPYIGIKIPRGEEMIWKIRYQFYLLPG